MTGQELLLNVLSYIGITTFQPWSNGNALNRPSVRQNDIVAGIAAINAALQEIQEKGPTEFKQDRRSVTLFAPVTVTLEVTSPDQITMTAGKQDWMLGCSIQISGDPYLNEIVGFSGNDVSLLREDTAMTGTVEATVYCDAVLLEDDVKAVMEPVEMPPNRRLTPAQSRADFDRYSYQMNSCPTPATSISKTVGIPQLYWVEPFYSLFENYLPLYIRVNPMPGNLTSLIFRAERKTERVDESIYSTDDQDPGYEFTSVPADMVESTLLPLARAHFAAHPNFKNREARQAIADQAVTARNSLMLGTTFVPSRQRVRARYK